MAFQPSPERIQVATIKVPSRYRAGKHMLRAVMLLPLAFILDGCLIAYLIAAADAHPNLQLRPIRDQDVGILMAALPGACVVYFALGLLWFFATARSSYRRWVLAELRERIGDTEHVDVFCGPGVGAAIALDTRRQVIHVVGGRQFVRMPWAAVRSWNWRIEGHDSIVVLNNNLGAAYAAGLINDARKNAAARSSGLFFQVSDVKVPSVQFACTNRWMLERWHEILTQFNEGALA